MPEYRVPVVLSTAASDDVLSIYRYIAEHGSPTAADDIYEQLLDAIARIGEYPESGASRDYVRPNYRIIPVSSWTIWYRWRPSDRHVVVMRVLHGHMDVDRHLP